VSRDDRRAALVGSFRRRLGCALRSAASVKPCQLHAIFDGVLSVETVRAEDTHAGRMFAPNSCAWSVRWPSRPRGTREPTCCAMATQDVS
jgi:hypothetical protein